MSSLNACWTLASNFSFRIGLPPLKIWLAVGVPQLDVRHPAGTSETVSTGLILAIAIPASGILLMRFRKRWLAKFNIVVTNRITRLFAGWLPGFGILTHVGANRGRSTGRP